MSTKVITIKINDSTISDVILLHGRVLILMSDVVCYDI